MNMAKSKHWLLHICVCLLLLAGLPDSRAATVHAESSVQLGVTPGIRGEYKQISEDFPSARGFKYELPLFSFLGQPTPQRS